MNILNKFRPIKTFVFDVDGVLTNGSLLVLNDGQMARSMNIKDGYALQLAVKKCYRVLIISGGTSQPVNERLLKLGITEVFMQVNDKKKLLSEYVTSEKILWQQLLYMGDDIPDYECLQIAGLACCPADAVNQIKSISNYISHLKGGEGCVRDVIEKVLKLNNNWDLDQESPAI